MAKSKKKMFGIIGIGFIALIVILGVVSENYDKEVLGPAQDVKIMNSSNEERIVYFYSEIPDENGEIPTGYFYKFVVQPGETCFDKIHQGRYSYEIWGNNDADLLFEYKNLSILEDSEENDHDYLYIDLSPESFVTVLGINYLYGGGEFAETMSAAVGTDMTKPFIEKIYAGGKAFKLPQIMYDRDLVVDYGEKIPSEISYSKLVYALVPVANTVQNKVEALDAATRYIEANL